MTLRQGRWQDVLQDVTECDAVIGDPPYSEATHKGWNAGEQQVRTATGQQTRQRIKYEPMTEGSVDILIDSWVPRCRGWMGFMTDDFLIGPHRQSYRKQGRYDFAPVIIHQKRPRLLGDGPSSWAIYFMVARPKTREFSTWGCLPGSYEANTVSVPGISGAKPLDLMCAIVRDYSKPDDLIVDTHAGSGTTLLAAAQEGRRAIGAEMNPATFELAVKRLSKGYTERLFRDGIVGTQETAGAIAAFEAEEKRKRKG